MIELRSSYDVKESGKERCGLVRRAEHRAMLTKHAVRKYNDLIQTSADGDAAKLLTGQLGIERAVLRYNEVHKAIRKLRRRMGWKSTKPSTHTRLGIDR
jgi:hypothetical protein